MSIGSISTALFNYDPIGNCTGGRGGLLLNGLLAAQAGQSLIIALSIPKNTLTSVSALSEQYLYEFLEQASKLVFEEGLERQYDFQVKKPFHKQKTPPEKVKMV